MGSQANHLCRRSTWYEIKVFDNGWWRSSWSFSSELFTGFTNDKGRRWKGKCNKIKRGNIIVINNTKWMSMVFINIDHSFTIFTFIFIFINTIYIITLIIFIIFAVNFILDDSKLFLLLFLDMFIGNFIQLMAFIIASCWSDQTFIISQR